MKRTIGFLAAIAFSLTISSVAVGQEELPSPDGDAPAPAPKQQAPRYVGIGDDLDAELGAPGGLTADDAAAHAAASSHAIEARRADVLAAAAAVDDALLGYAPKLTLSARYARVSKAGGGDAGMLVAAPDVPEGPIAPDAQLVNVSLSFPQQLNQYTLQAQLNVPLSDYVLRIPNAHGAARASERAAELKLLAEERNAEVDARLAYYGLVRARMSVVVSRQAVRTARAHVADARRAVDAGSATPADLLSAEAQLASAELWRTRSRELAKVSQSRLRILMHQQGKRTLRIGEDVRDELPALRLGGDESLEREGLRRRVELKAMKAHEKALGEQLELARAGYSPRLDAYGNATYANPNQRVFPQDGAFHGSWEVGLQLTYTLNDVPRAAIGVRSIEAQIAGNKADREQLADSIRDEIMTARSSLTESGMARDVGTRKLAAAEEAYRVRHVLFREGAATMTELLDAETDLSQARLEVLNAMVDMRIARTRLLHALGRRGS